MTKPVCPCQISSSGNFYRHHVPDCPNAVPSAAPVVTESGEYDRARYLHMMRQSVPVPDAVVSQPEGTRELPDDHIKHVKAFLLEMYQTMVDPVEEFQGNGIAELCQLLLKRAREDREALASPTPAVSGQADQCAFCIRDSETNCDACGRKICGNHRTVGHECDLCPNCYHPMNCDCSESHGKKMCELGNAAPPSLPKAGETEKVNNGQN